MLNCALPDMGHQVEVTLYFEKLHMWLVSIANILRELHSNVISKFSYPLLLTING